MSPSSECFSRTPVHGELYSRLAQLENIVPLYYVDSIDTDDHPPHTSAWCLDHARKVARVESILVGADMLVTSAWTEDDRMHRCEWHGCDVALRAGGLTDHGVDEALALTESKPLEAATSAAELVLASDAMMQSDPRWKVWHWHACNLLGIMPPFVETHGGCGGVVLLRSGEWRCSGCRKIVSLESA